MESSSYDSSLWKKQAVKLLDLGEKLHRLPSTTDEIIRHLEKAESILVNVQQGIPCSKADALFPLMKALIAEELFRHADLNIQVAVASCLNQLTRISAPVYPYEDDQMKEIFQLFMVALRQLLTESGIIFERAQVILKSMAQVRSCLMMLDIEVDSMIVEMFQFFLSNIRSNHSDIFKHMETIMILIINESDEVSLELLTPLLDSVRKNRKEISPTSWELGKTIFEKCGPKLQSYLREAVKHLNLKLDDYAEIVASLCVVTANEPNMVSESDKVHEADNNDSIPQTNGSDDKNSMEDNANLARLITNNTSSDYKEVNGEKILQSEKRVRKMNSLMRPEEGYAHICTRGGQGPAAVFSDGNNNENNLLVPLKPGNGSSPGKSSFGKKVVSGKRGCSKKEGIRKKIRCEIISQKSDTRDIADKVSESDKVSEDDQHDSIPKTKDGNGLDNFDDKNSMENSAEFVLPVINKASSGDKLMDDIETVQHYKRVRKMNSLMRPEEGYAHIWTRGSQNSSKVSPLLNGNGSDEKKSTENSAEFAHLITNSAISDNNLVNGSDIAHSKKCDTRDIADKVSESDKVSEDNSAEFVLPVINNASSGDKLMNGIGTVQHLKRVRKMNSLMRPEEGYAHIWTRGSQNSSKVSSFLNQASESDRVPETDQDDCVPRTNNRNGLDEKNSTENSAEFAHLITNSASSNNKLLNGADITHSKKRVRKMNSLFRLEEGYAHRWTRGGHEVISQKNETGDTVDKIVESHLSLKTEETSSRSSVGEEMVNVRIKVWWPLDKTFYTGTVKAFDPLTKKHKIEYDNDEEEILSLGEERWELFKERS